MYVSHIKSPKLEKSPLKNSWEDDAETTASNGAIFWGKRFNLWDDKRPHLLISRKTLRGCAGLSHALEPKKL